MNADTPHKRALELLRKRYRLPISVIVHAIPPQYLSSWEESDGRVTGMVSTRHEAQQLLELCQSIGSSEIGFHFAEFISLDCVHALESLFVDDVSLRMLILNPPVVKEKLRLFSVLGGHRLTVKEALLKVQGEENLQELTLLRCRLAHELERCRCKIERLMQMKSEGLDSLLFLVLAPDASAADVAEGLWILQHHRPSEHGTAVHPDDGTISWAAIQGIRHRIRERLGNNLPKDGTLLKVRAHVLGVFGRYHFESKLEHVLENTRAALQKYMHDPTTEPQVILTINAQLEVLTCLATKRSLVGCYPIVVPGEPNGPNSDGEVGSDGSQDGESDGESSGTSNARAESSITPSSIVSTDSELYDSEILVIQSKDEDEGQVGTNVAGQAAAPVAKEPIDVVEIAEEDEEIYDESGDCAIMEFCEIEGESVDARTKRFSIYCASLDYCL